MIELKQNIKEILSKKNFKIRVQEETIIYENKQLLIASGGVFNSPDNTLKKGDYYLVGLNPGQAGMSCDNKKKYTIEYGLENLNHHVYADDKWGNYPKNKAPFQKSVRAFFNAIGADLLSTCCSNLYFIRTQDENELKSFLKDNPLLRPGHLQVHKEILKVIQPKTIIFFSSTAYNEFKVMLANGLENPNSIIVKGSRREIDSGHKRKVIKLRRFQVPDGSRYNIVLVPHFSRYAFYSLRTETRLQIGEEIQHYLKSN